MNQDAGIRTLLDLHGQVLVQEEGFWTKIEAWEVEKTIHIPHGIRYALSLHAPHGKRLLGYDNAHAVRHKSGKFAGHQHVFDHHHRHSSDKGIPYEFTTAFQLLSDFFREADVLLSQIQSK